MDALSLHLRESKGALHVAVRVKPRARRNEVLGVKEGALVVAVAAAPQNGEANRAVVLLLSKILKTPQATIAITHGAAARDKLVRIKGLSCSDLLHRLTEHA